MKIHIIEPDIPFLSKKATAACRKAWRKLFSQLLRQNVHPASTDVLLWVLMADSGTVLLTPRSTNTDEDDPEWESPDDEVGFGVEGLCEELNRFRGAKQQAEQKKVYVAFYDWMTAAIIDSFQSASIQKLFNEYNPESLPISIFWSPHEESMRFATKRLLWRNEGGLSPDRVTEKQAALQEGARYKAVRKKSPSEIDKLRSSGAESTTKKRSSRGSTKKHSAKKMSQRRKTTKKKK